MKLDEIINSWENRPQAFTGQKVDEATFIGPNSASWQPGAYEEALRMEQAGYSPEYIWQKTGTGRGATGEMRQEIEDNRASLNLSTDIVNKVQQNSPSEYGMLGDYLKHDTLYDAYPGIGVSHFGIEQNKKNNYIGTDPNTGEDILSFTKARGGHYPGGALGDGEGDTGYAGINSDAANILYETYGFKNKAEKGDNFDLDVVNEYFKDHITGADQSIINNMALPNQSVYGSVEGYNKPYGKKRTANDIFSTILHENQHGIQSIEGWGGNIGNGDWKKFIRENPEASQLLADQYKGWAWPDSNGEYTIPYSDISQGDKDYTAYLYQPVEAEARLTQTREDLSKDERRKYFPFNKQTEDNPYGYDINPQAMKGLLESFNNR